MDDTLAIISSYPRKRPFISEDQKKVYEKEYLINREGLTFITKLSQLAESWMHYKVASLKGDNVLEIGAGSLNHLKYEKYKTYDIIEPFKQAYANNEKIKKINKIYTEILEVPEKNRYDKIFSVAVLEHLDNLPCVIAHAGLLLKEGGIFQNGIPNEGGMLWHLGLCVTGIGFRLRHKVSCYPMMRHEHINNSNEIIKVIKYFFKDVRVKKFPLPFHHLSMYVYIEATQPRRDVCEEYLRTQSLLS